LFPAPRYPSSCPVLTLQPSPNLPSPPTPKNNNASKTATESDVRLSVTPTSSTRLPPSESPCFTISRITLQGDAAERFNWALDAANIANDTASDDPAIGRCLGTVGINTVMTRIQNAIVARGFVTTRILAAPQDLTTGILLLTLIPGRIRHIRFAPGTARRATRVNAVAARQGDLLNLRDIEQSLENFQRIPTVRADIKIVPAEKADEDADAQPGESDLIIAWQQRAPPARLTVSLDDAGSRATGIVQGGVTLSLDSPLMLNDLFYVHGNRDLFNGAGKATRGYSVHYSVPWRYWLLAANASRYQYHQTVAGLSQSYVYRGISRNADLRLSRLLYRNTRHKFGAYVGGWRRRSRNFIDDTEIEVQRRRTAGWEAGLTHRAYLGQATLDARLGVRRGTGAFRSQPAPEQAFGEGTSRMRLTTAEVQFLLPLALRSQRLRYHAHWRAQWPRTPLTPQDRFAIGGRYSVRGFDGERSLMGERGWWLRNDLGLALGAGQELYIGADVGRVGGAATRTLTGRTLAGAAIGLRGGAKGAWWDVFIGTPLHKPKTFQTKSTTAGFQLGWSY